MTLLPCPLPVSPAWTSAALSCLIKCPSLFHGCLPSGARGVSVFMVMPFLPPSATLGETVWRPKKGTSHRDTPGLKSSSALVGVAMHAGIYFFGGAGYVLDDVEALLEYLTEKKKVSPRPWFFVFVRCCTSNSMSPPRVLFCERHEERCQGSTRRHADATLERNDIPDFSVFFFLFFRAESGVH